MPNEVVTLEYDGEVYTIEVPEGTPDADIEAFIRFNQRKERTLTESFARNVAEPFNRGVASVLDTPAALINAFSGGIAAADAAIAGREGVEAPQVPLPFTEAGTRLGGIAPPEEQETGIIPRFAELAGASALPFSALVRYGGMAAQELKAVPTAFQQMGIATAQSPGKAGAFDIAANFSAAVGGETARGLTDNDAVIAMAEFGSAFVPTAAVLLPKVTPGGRSVAAVKDMVTETVAPFTEAGARPKAARRLQSVAADPEAAAAAIDPDSPLPPAQQTGDPDLIKLQQNILNKNPALKQDVSDDLAKAIRILQSDADFGGDMERAMHLLNTRQQMAVEEAANAVANFASGATPRRISVAAARSVSRALDDATTIEDYIWRKLDTKAPADVVNARQALGDEIAARSPDADPDDIPKWLQAKLNQSPLDPRMMDSLRRQGYVSEDGAIDPAIMSALERQGALRTRQRTLDDVQTIRSRVLREMRAERAKDAPNRNKIRILNDVQEALLEDMTATGVQGVDDARAFSAAVNERFRRGRVGRLMGFDTTGAERVSPEDMLQEVVFGPRSATTTKRFIEAASAAPDQTLDFIKTKYLEATTVDGRINIGAHNRFIKNMRDKGMFELFPELEGQLNAVRNVSDRAGYLNVPESQINTTRINSEQTAAALFLQAEPGREMQLALKSKNPKAAVRNMMAIINKEARSTADRARAKNGVKSAFSEEIIRLSAGDKIDTKGRPIPRGKKMKQLLSEYRQTMRAMDMSNEEIARLENIAESIRKAQLKPGTGEIGTGVLDEPLLAPIDLLARFVGARAGGNLGDDMGSRLVLAQFWSKQMRDRVAKFTTNRAEDLLIEATTDPELYRALLLGPTAAPELQRRAAQAIERAVLRSESIGRVAGAIAVTEEEDDR